MVSHPRFAHTLKYIVYTSLVINGALYIRDDMVAVLSSLPADATWIDYLTQIATSIDTVGWLGLVFLFELETYSVPDERWTAVLGRTIHALRIACYASIAVATYGYTVEGLENFDAVEIPGTTNACQLAGQGTILQLNQFEYAEITESNCNELSDDQEFYRIANEVSVIDETTLNTVQRLGIVDINNAAVWLIVVWLIEIELWLQARDRFSSPVLRGVRQAKTLFYLVLIAHVGIWCFVGYYRYAWDAFLWIFGFWAIEMNLAEWEVDRLEELGASKPK
ncbi:MAG: hypothetical protein OEW59_04925 [Gammaproteobacteria bacterium]|nr:hypothetical protein [Gammaproteobacteria bacterium]